MATIGNISFAIHDWIFTQEYLNASMMMPLALKMVDPRSSEDIEYYNRQKRKAKVITWITTALFYILIIAYFFVSTITANFVWRTSINAIFFYIAAIFCISLLKIRRLIKDQKQRKKYRTNTGLLNITFLTFALEGFTYGSVFMLAILKNRATSSEKVAYCRISLAFDVVYWLLWGVLLTRTMLTSYLNVKFSRDLEESNKQFFIIFNEDYTVARKEFDDDRRKKLEQISVERRLRFYQEYAD